MLSLRLAIFTALSGIALWGLFSLLDTLREPALLRSAKSIVVKGCDPIESDHAAQRCPQLFCQKFLLEQRLLPMQATFDTTIDRRSGAQHLIAGRARVESSGAERHFACILDIEKVTAGRLLDAERLNALALQPAGWTLD